MRKYNHEKIDKILQPVMDMMREEFPNDCKLIVGPDFSTIMFEHAYLTFPSEEMKKPYCETEQGKEFIQDLKNTFKQMEEYMEKAEDEEGAE